MRSAGFIPQDRAPTRGCTTMASGVRWWTFLRTKVRAPIGNWQCGARDLSRRTVRPPAAARQWRAAFGGGRSCGLKSALLLGIGNAERGIYPAGPCVYPRLHDNGERRSVVDVPAD